MKDEKEEGTPGPGGERRDLETAAGSERPAGSESREAFSFEKGLERLEQIVESLERDDVSLEESLKLWEEGAALVRKLEEILDRAQAKIEQVLHDEDGRVFTIPIEREPG